MRMSACTVCGGTGIQRVSSQRFRTCLACLGTGQNTVVSQPLSLSRGRLSDAVMDRSTVLPGRPR